MTRSPATERDEATDAPPEPLDLRLAVGAALAWLVTVLCRGCPPGVVAALGVGAAGLGLLALRLRRRGGPVLALCGFVVALVLLPLAARLAHGTGGPLHTLALRHASADLILRVGDDPRALTPTGLSGTQRVAVAASAESVTVGGRRVDTDGRVLVLGDASGWRGVLPGQQVRVSGALQPDLSGRPLSVTLFERGSPERLGRPPWWQRAAGGVRESLARAARVLPDQDAGLLPGLVDGDTGGLDPVLAEHFQLAGLTHLVAVSGLICQ